MLRSDNSVFNTWELRTQPVFNENWEIGQYYLEDWETDIFLYYSIKIEKMDYISIDSNNTFPSIECQANAFLVIQQFVTFSGEPVYKNDTSGASYNDSF